MLQLACITPFFGGDVWTVSSYTIIKGQKNVLMTVSSSSKDLIIFKLNIMITWIINQSCHD